jgi:hypothetical protein
MTDFPAVKFGPGPMLVPDCPIHAGPFGAEVVKLRAENAALREANAKYITVNDDLDAVVSAVIRMLRERGFVA